MRKLIAIALLAGCAGYDDGSPTDGGTQDGGVELGQTASALTLPNWYGTVHNGKGVKCDPGGASFCYFPSTKSRRLVFKAGTCSAFWQGRLIAAENAAKASVQAAGWTYSSGGDEATANIVARCNQSSTPVCGDGAWACTTNAASTCTNLVCKVSKNVIWIETYLIEHDTFEVNWAAQSQTRKDKWGYNVWLHELGHAFGLGHDLSYDGVFGDPAVINSQLPFASMYPYGAYRFENATSFRSWNMADLTNYVP